MPYRATYLGLSVQVPRVEACDTDGFEVSDVAGGDGHVLGRLFLRLNNITLNPTQDEAFTIVMALAGGEIEVAELASLIADHAAETPQT